MEMKPGQQKPGDRISAATTVGNDRASYATSRWSAESMSRLEFGRASQNQVIQAAPKNEGVIHLGSTPQKRRGSNKRNSNASYLSHEGNLQHSTAPLDAMNEEYLPPTLEGHTTVILRNIPCKYTQMALFEEMSLINMPFDFLYLPMARRVRRNLGYAFINFKTHEIAKIFVHGMQGYKFIKQPNSEKRLDVSYSRLQGYEENVKFYAKVRESNDKCRPWVESATAKIVPTGKRNPRKSNK
jgi:RNA recognition motif-containing protein